jgi:formylglycine-generating enzyme
MQKCYVASSPIPVAQSRRLVRAGSGYLVQELLTMSRPYRYPSIIVAAMAIVAVALASAQPPAAPPGPGGAPHAGGPLLPGMQARAVPPLNLDTIKDCADCPEMVVIPSGGFMMGSDMPERSAEGAQNMLGREGPRHAVLIRHAFAIGRTEITRGMYAGFAAQNPSVEKGRECGAFFPGRTPYDEPPIDPAAATVRNWRTPGFPQSEAEPAVCVSYNDAEAFVAWLSHKTGKTYRLPTEAEWEYAARGWTVTSRYWGDDSRAICRNANVLSTATVAAQGNSERFQGELLCLNDHPFTAKVASLTPNPFGLYDVIGNVAEVVEGCAHENYEGAPADGSAWTQAGCKLHNWRGGSYMSQAWLARAAGRIQQTADYRNPDFGLRVARDLN